MRDADRIAGIVNEWFQTLPTPTEQQRDRSGLIADLRYEVERIQRTTRVKVAEVIAKSLEAEVAWQREKYGDGSDKVATGRLVGMEDALRIAREHGKES